eukprot:138945-Hanusia_phi.AAC.1
MASSTEKRSTVRHRAATCASHAAGPGRGPDTGSGLRLSPGPGPAAGRLTVAESDHDRSRIL